MSSEIEARRLKLIEELKELARDEGVRREGLRELLRSNLTQLTQALRIDLSQEEATVRKAIEASLYSQILQISPPASRRPLTVEQRKKQYVGCLLTCFNMQQDASVQRLKLGARQAWLAESARGLAQVAERTSRRELEHGISALAVMLSGGNYVPDSTPVAAADLAQFAGSSESGDEASPPGVRNKPWYAKRSTVSAAGVIAVILLVGGITFAAGGFDGFLGEGKPGAPDENGAGPSSSNSAAGADAPYELNVYSNPDELNRFGVLMSYYFDKPIEQIPAPPADSTDCSGKHKWALENGGVPTGQTALQVQLYSRNKPIHILGARVEVVERKKLKPGSIITCRKGSPIEERYVRVQLSSRPKIEYRPHGTLNPEPFTFEIQPGSTELLGVAGSLGSDPENLVIEDFYLGYAWKFALSVTIDGKPQEIVVDDHGKPFLVYGAPEGSSSYEWRDGRWKNVLER